MYKVSNYTIDLPPPHNTAMCGITTFNLDEIARAMGLPFPGDDDDNDW
jgi:hypothetical protein